MSNGTFIKFEPPINEITQDKVCIKQEMTPCLIDIKPNDLITALKPIKISSTLKTWIYNFDKHYTDKKGNMIYVYKLQPELNGDFVKL